jgi:hypothetical protein
MSPEEVTSREVSADVAPGKLAPLDEINGRRMTPARHPPPNSF